MKEKHTVSILGMNFNLVSEESEEYLNKLALNIETRIKEMTMKNQRINKMEAAVFCALDYLDLKVKSDLRAEEAKKQYDDYERVIADLQQENAELKKLLGK